MTKRYSDWAYRVVIIGGLIIGLGFTAFVLCVRYWIFPNLEKHRVEIAQRISEAANQTITIGAIQADWDGLRPNLILSDVLVMSADGQPMASFKSIKNTLSWSTLIYAELRFSVFEIDRPQIDLRRDEAGTFFLGGIALDKEEYGLRFLDWILRQRHVLIEDALISWQDDQLKAPRLEFKNVSLQIENSGHHHRFGLAATPPENLASPLDVRGDLVGKSVKDIASWRGKLFLQTNYTDIVAWRTWFSIPINMRHGTGGLRLWLGVNGTKLEAVTADVRLANVDTRLAANLPELNLKSLSGRLGWKNLENGFEVSTNKLALTMQDGMSIKPVDFSFRLEHDADNKPIRGKLHANLLEFEPLLALADRLPIDPAAHQKLLEFSPRGLLSEIDLAWDGVWPKPDHYSVNVKFNGIAILSHKKLPGFSGMSGEIKWSEKGGNMNIASHKASVELSSMFKQPLRYDTLNWQASWTLDKSKLEVKFTNAIFANEDMAGKINGQYRRSQDGIEWVDITGDLSRMDARRIGLYIPLFVGKMARVWPDTSVKAGELRDIRLHIMGNIAEFPFDDGRNGIFEVNTKIHNIALYPAPGWPQIENINGEVHFRGKRLEVVMQQANLWSIKLNGIRSVIPDLFSGDEILEVQGVVAGSTTDFLKFVEQSPVKVMLGGFTETMRASGPGRLAIKLNYPLRRPNEAKVSGTYQFTENMMVAEEGMPPVEKLTGVLDFTESSISIKNASALVFGGPANINAGTKSDGTINISVRGKVNVDNMRKTSANALVQRLSGNADWRADIRVQKKIVDVTIDSTLQGLASDLPTPFNKTASDVTRLHIDMREVSPQTTKFSLNYGSALSAVLIRKKEGGRSSFKRGMISFGSNATLPNKEGVIISGILQNMDVDDWRTIMASSSLIDSASSSHLLISGVDLRMTALDIFGRRFNELKINADVVENVWQIKLAGREMNGDIVWNRQGSGKVSARMKNFTISAAGPAKAKPTLTLEPPKQTNAALPSLDVTIETFKYNDKTLGKLDLLASPEGDDWRIQKLQLNNANGNISIDGRWTNASAVFATQCNIQIELNDIGKFFTRLGLVDGVKKGNAKLEGAVSWNGSPADFNYDTLNGSLILEAQRGQFLKVEPGIGKLIGILSLQSLPRRIRLDFTDVFSEGLAFDEITGVIKITNGIISTDNLKMRGPAVRIIMKGDVDLIKETQNLQVVATPNLGDSLSLAAFASGPVVGIASFVLQKILKDPFDQLAAYEYQISGGWADSTVVKVSKPAVKPVYEPSK